MKLVTPTIKPSPKQYQAWQKLQDKETKFVLFGGAAGGGKTWLGCEWLLTSCYFYPGTRYFIGRDELKKIKDTTFITWSKCVAHHKIPSGDWNYNGQGNYIEFTNGSRIDFLDLKFLPSDPLYERYGSYEFTSGWLEEAGEVHGKAFETLKSRIGRCKNDEYDIQSKLLCTANPKKNWLYNEFYKPQKENVLPVTHAFISALVSDNPYIETSYEENLRAIKDPVLKARLLAGQWEYEEQGQLIEYDAILDLFTNPVEEIDEVCASVDAARYGSDKTVVWSWKGFEATLEKALEHTGTDVTAQILGKISLEKNIPRSRFIIDEDGIGGGVIDQFKGSRGFVAGSLPIEKKMAFREEEKKEQYRNLKAQCTYKFAEMVNARKFKVNCDEETKQWVIEDLEQMKRKDPDKDGKLEIVPKDEIKAVLGRSPDYGDALMMRMVFELERGLPRVDKDEMAFERMMREKRRRKKENSLSMA